MDITDAADIAQRLSDRGILTVPTFKMTTGLCTSRVRYWLKELQEQGLITTDIAATDRNRSPKLRGRPTLHYKFIGPP